MPRLRGGHRAWLEISLCVDCLPVLITLTGTGVAPQLFVSPPEIRFDPVPIGFTARHEILLRNDGDAPMRIDEVRVDPDFTVFELDLDAEFPRELAPNESVTGEVRFNPPESGIYRAEILVRTAGDELRFDLFGRGGGPLLVVESPPPRLLPLGASSAEVVAIRNVGDPGDVQFRSVALLDDSGVFELDAAWPAASDGAWWLPLSVRALRPGLHQATLRIEAQLAFQPVLEVPLELYVPEAGCDLRIDPAGPIRLGVIDGDRTLNLDIQVTHEGEGECLIWNPRVEAGAMTLVGNPVSGHRFLAPGETVSFRLRRAQSPYNVLQPAVHTRFLLSHSQVGDEAEVSISFQQANPFPLLAVEPAVFPDTPVGKESLWWVNIQLRPGHSLAIQPYAIVDDEAQFRLSPEGPMGQRAVMFRPTSTGPKSALFEIRLFQLEEPVLVDLEAKALPPCEETCDWPSTTCGYAVEESAAPPPFHVLRNVVVEATPQPPELTCQWFSTPFIGSLAGFGCHGGSFQRGGPAAFSTTLYQLAWDDQRRAASCELQVDLPEYQVGPE